MFVVILWISLSASAYDFEVDGIYYDVESLSDRTCSVTYKDRVKIDGKTRFYNDFASETLVIPSTVEYAGQTLKVIGIKFAAYEDNTCIKKLIVPNSIQYLFADCFNCCTSLEEVIIEEGAEILNFHPDHGAESYFNDCPINKLYIGRQIAINKYSPFSDLPLLTDVKLTNTTTSLIQGMFEGCVSLNHIVIPSSCSVIGESAFWGCKELKNIEFLGTLSEVGKSAFSGCTSLTGIKLGPLSTLGAYAFCDCENLESIELDNGITYLSKGVLSGCKSLKTFNIPTTVSGIEVEAMKGCEAISEINIPSSVKYIRFRAFEECNSLKKLIFESCSEQIDLDGCQMYESISIFGSPKNTILEYLKIDRPISYTKGCLYFCNLKTLYLGSLVGDLNSDLRESPLNEIYCRAVNPPNISISLTNNQYMTVPVYVPIESVDTYKSDYDWGNFWQIKGYDFTEESDIEKITSNNEQIEPVYYGLDGTILPSEPKSGLFIKQQGSCSKKILK